MSDEPVSDLWLIWSFDHKAWWRPDRAGYTGVHESAGRYSLEEAEEICRQPRHRCGSTGSQGQTSDVMVKERLATSGYRPMWRRPTATSAAAESGET